LRPEDHQPPLPLWLLTSPVPGGAVPSAGLAEAQCRHVGTHARGAGFGGPAATEHSVRVLSDAAKTALRAGRLAHLVTVEPDGSPPPGHAIRISADRISGIRSWTPTA
jgi:hypothetical protein